MNFDLAGDSSRRQTIRWLKRLIRHMGPGFHLDTAPSDYVTSAGEPLLTPAECATLQRSLDRLFQIMGCEPPYEIGAEVTSHLLCRNRGWKPPLLFHDPQYQQGLLQYGTREQLIAWLRWHDPQRQYTDRDLQRQGRSPLTLDDARSLLGDQIER